MVGELREEVGKVVVGNREVVDGVLTCMLAGSHALL
ncbi:MAG: AAA family ATPase, partial [Myxococcales bacterium]|nr:AAA family ATPase [Myxococcales bacterium]